MLRLDPQVHERVTSRPEGARAYVTNLVEQDVRREASASLVTSADLAEVPGQLLMAEALATPKPPEARTRKKRLQDYKAGEPG